MKTESSLYSIEEHPEWLERAADWFSQKWQIPKTVYQESMQASLTTGNSVPHWFIVVNQEQEVIAGIGLIANDFHQRKELTPNICALFVQERYRRQGIASELLTRACQQAKQGGYDWVYLLTDQTNFYERLGWNYFTLVAGEDGTMERMYRKHLGVSSFIF